jgi:tRNA threonylcarbamoyladenosine biosynthesis protein TsaE
MKIQMHLENLNQFKNFVANQILPQVKPRTLFLLEGEVGAGKTELVKTICELLNLKDVQSPTFSFHHTYANTTLKLQHVDLYRLKSEEDLESIGFWDLFEDEKSTLLVEWSNLIHTENWPWNWKLIKVQIIKIDSNPEAREIILELN